MSCLNDNDSSFVMQFVQENIGIECKNLLDSQKPHRIYKPVISRDGNQYCVLFGDNLVDGVAGFGASPAEAMADFDKNWYEPIPTIDAAALGD